MTDLEILETTMAKLEEQPNQKANTQLIIGVFAFMIACLIDSETGDERLYRFARFLESMTGEWLIELGEEWS